MKSYSHFAKEITPEELYDGLVGCGLFAERIPHFLTSKSFLAYSKTITLPGLKKSRDYIRYNSMRNINVPRAMAIPDPFIYASLCYELKVNWSRITKHFVKQTKYDKHKISRIHIRKLYDKCSLFEMNYKRLYDDGEPNNDLLIKSKFISKADISKCFPSIYSHAVPWALVGKLKAKSAKNHDKNWFNKLDARIRNVKYGETNGVLIGPHASNLISEIILTKVDRELVKKNFQFVRNIDDYVCYAKSYEEAEKFQLELATELANYELTLNLKKSEIVPLPTATVKSWVNKLKHYPFIDMYKNPQGKESLKARELLGYLDFAIELMLQENSDSSVLNYALKVIANKHLGRNALDLFIKRVHHLVLLYPYLIQILEEFVFDSHKVNKNIIKQIAHDIYVLGLDKRLYEPCSYAMYWAMKYDFSIDLKNIKQKAIKSEDCIFMLLSYLYHKKHEKKSFLKEYTDKATELKLIDFDRYWLYIYEVLPNTELIDEYKGMKKKGISFIKNEFK